MRQIEHLEEIDRDLTDEEVTKVEMYKICVRQLWYGPYELNIILMDIKSKKTATYLILSFSSVWFTFLV